MNHINNFIRSFHALLNVLWEMQQCSLLCVQCLQHLKAFLMSCQAWIIRDQEFLINKKKKNERNNKNECSDSVEGVILPKTRMSLRHTPLLQSMWLQHICVSVLPTCQFVPYLFMLSLILSSQNNAINIWIEKKRRAYFTRFRC